MLIFGTLKTYFSEKGFGFIRREDGERDAFVHIRDLESGGIFNPTVGMRLSFTVETDQRSNRSRAANLKAA